MDEYIPFLFQGAGVEMIDNFFPRRLPTKGECLVLEVYDVRYGNTSGNTTPQQEVVRVELRARWRIIACPPLPADDVTREG